MTIQKRFENYIRLVNRIREYEGGDYTAYITSVSYGAVVMSGDISDRTARLAINKAELAAQYTADKKEIESLNRYINSITDVEIKEICILKYTKGWSWEQIAARLRYERTSVAKKIKRYFEKFPTIPA